MQKFILCLCIFSSRFVMGMNQEISATLYSGELLSDDFYTFDNNSDQIDLEKIRYNQDKQKGLLLNIQQKKLNNIKKQYLKVLQKNNDLTINALLSPDNLLELINTDFNAVEEKLQLQEKEHIKNLHNINIENLVLQVNYKKFIQKYEKDTKIVELLSKNHKESVPFNGQKIQKILQDLEHREEQINYLKKEYEILIEEYRNIQELTPLNYKNLSELSETDIDILQKTLGTLQDNDDLLLDLKNQAELINTHFKEVFNRELENSLKNGILNFNYNHTKNVLKLIKKAEQTDLPQDFLGRYKNDSLTIGLLPQNYEQLINLDATSVQKKLDELEQKEISIRELQKKYHSFLSLYKYEGKFSEFNFCNLTELSNIDIGELEKICQAMVKNHLALKKTIEKSGTLTSDYKKMIEREINNIKKNNIYELNFENVTNLYNDIETFLSLKKEYVLLKNKQRKNELIPKERYDSISKKINDDILKIEKEYNKKSLNSSLVKTWLENIRKHDIQIEDLTIQHTIIQEKKISQLIENNKLLQAAETIKTLGEYKSINNTDVIDTNKLSFFIIATNKIKQLTTTSDEFYEEIIEYKKGGDCINKATPDIIKLEHDISSITQEISELQKAINIIHIKDKNVQEKLDQLIKIGKKNDVEINIFLVQMLTNLASHYARNIFHPIEFCKLLDAILQYDQKESEKSKIITKNNWIAKLKVLKNTFSQLDETMNLEWIDRITNKLNESSDLIFSGNNRDVLVECLGDLNRNAFEHCNLFKKYETSAQQIANVLYKKKQLSSEEKNAIKILLEDFKYLEDHKQNLDDIYYVYYESTSNDNDKE